MKTERPERANTQPIVQQSRSKLERREKWRYDEEDTEDHDRLADLGAGIFRWIGYSICAFLLFVVVVVASK